MIDVQKTIEKAEAEIERMGDGEFVMKIPIVKVVSLCSVIQLALRHPEMPEPTRSVTRTFVDNLIDVVERASPDLAALMRLGDDPLYDKKKRIAAEEEVENSRQVLWNFFVENHDLHLLESELNEIILAVYRCELPDFERCIKQVVVHLSHQNRTYIEIAVDPKTNEIGWSFAPTPPERLCNCRDEKAGRCPLHGDHSP